MILDLWKVFRLKKRTILVMKFLTIENQVGPVDPVCSEKVNIKFMNSVFKIATSPAPDFNPLLLDGNYLNWRLNTLKK